jgi:hypothetical protein
MCTSCRGPGTPLKWSFCFDRGLVKLVDLAAYRTVDDNFLQVGEHAEKIACSPDGNRIAAAYATNFSGQVAVFDVDTRERIFTIGRCKPLV